MSELRPAQWSKRMLEDLCLRSWLARRFFNWLARKLRKIEGKSDGL